MQKFSSFRGKKNQPKKSLRLVMRAPLQLQENTICSLHFRSIINHEGAEPNQTKPICLRKKIRQTGEQVRCQLEKTRHMK